MLDYTNKMSAIVKKDGLAVVDANELEVLIKKASRIDKMRERSKEYNKSYQKQYMRMVRWKAGADKLKIPVEEYMEKHARKDAVEDYQAWMARERKVGRPPRVNEDEAGIDEIMEEIKDMMREEQKN